MEETDHHTSAVPDRNPYAPPAPMAPLASPPIASDLARAFDEVCQRETPSSTAELHAATSTLVTRLKDEGAPPERVLVIIKTALTRYGGSHLPPSFDVEDTALGERKAAVYRDVFAWCLDAYYGAI